MPKILNPQSGYLFSTNQSPFFVTAQADNLYEKDFPLTMGFQSRITNRAHRAFELLDNDKSISWKELDKYKHDNKYSLDSRQYKFLQKIFDFDFKDDVRLVMAQNFIQDWDLATDSENLHAAFGICILSPEWLAEIKQESQPDPIKIFKDCINEFEKKYVGVIKKEG